MSAGQHDWQDPQEIRREFAYWADRGVAVSTWSVDQRSGMLTVGVRDDVAAATPLLRERYGPNVEVVLRDPTPLPSRREYEPP